MALSRERMEEIIRNGGSVLVDLGGGKKRLVASIERLPSQAEMARTEKEKQAAADSIDSQIAALQAQKSGLNLYAGSVGELDLTSSNPQKGQTNGPLGEGVTEIKLPEDFPMRHVFEKLGFNSVEEIQSKSRDELIALNGIAATSADNALAYGK